MITATCACGTKIQYFRQIDRIFGYKAPRIHFFDSNGVEITNCPKCQKKLYLALLIKKPCRVETHPENEMAIDHFIKSRNKEDFILKSNWRK